jgi:hypothetical protein
MRVGNRIAVAVVAALLPLTASACTRPPPNPLPQLPPYRSDLYTPEPSLPDEMPESPSTSDSATVSPTGAPSVSASYPSVSATPIPGFPTATELAGVNEWVDADDWGFIQTPNATDASLSTAAIKINGLWKGAAGSLNNQAPAVQSGVDLSLATPYFLSWSYVITDGDYQAVPADIVFPSTTGTLFQITGPLVDHDCPDYAASVDRGIGVSVLQCTVVVSQDGGSITGLAFAVPNQTKQFWYFTAPDAVDKPS